MGTVYGASPQMRYDLVGNALTKSYPKMFANSGTWRAMADIQDVAWAYINALEWKSGIYNIVTRNSNILHLAREINDILGGKGEIDAIEKQDRNYQASNNNIKSLGWSPRRTFKEAICELATLNPPMGEKK